MPANNRHMAVILAAVVVVATLWPAAAQAHSLQRDGPVAGVLHINPDDNPRPGRPTVVTLDITSSDPAFTLNGYTVSVAIQPVGTSQSTATTSVILEPGSGSSESASIVFPQTGTYTLVFTGRPLNQGRVFAMRFDVTARQPRRTVETLATTAYGLMVVTASFGLLYIVARQQITKRGRYN